MTIHFYLNNEEETGITSLYEMKSNPFKIGDVIGLDIEELYPIDYGKYKEDFRKKMIEDNQTLEETFRRKSIKIVREGKYMRFKILSDTHLTIEYHCELIVDHVKQETKK